MSAASGLHLGEFGGSERQALRRLLTEFRHRGWQDAGDTALRIVLLISSEPGATAQRAARAAPVAFFATNRIGKRELASALADLARRP